MENKSINRYKTFCKSLGNLEKSRKADLDAGIKERISMDEKTKTASRLHYMLAFIGGFLGVYAILQRCDIFGSAQTANLIYLVTSILGRNVWDVLLRAGALFLYMAAVMLTVYLPSHTKVSVPVLSIMIDLAAVVILGFLPEEMNPVLALYPVFFAMAFQWCSFPGARGFTSSTIFSTNNFRQFSSALAEVVFNHRKEQLDKMRFFGGTLLSYHFGVAVSFLLWSHFHVKSVWFALVPVGAAGLLLWKRERGERRHFQIRVVYH